MSKIILFSLENCIKCNQTKEILIDNHDIEIITFPHDFSNWTNEDLERAKVHNVFDDLQKTAPILWVDGKKEIGYLRIRKWLQDNK